MTGKARMVGFIVLYVSIAAFAVNGAEKKNMVEANEYSIEISKANALFKVATKGRGGFHCNTMYPWKLTVKNGNGKETVYKKKDAKEFGEKGVSFLVNGTEGTLKFSVCNDQQCIMKTEKLTLK